MKRLCIFLIACSCLSFSVLAGDCSKDKAKASVLKICSIIESKGKGALMDIAKYRYCGSNYVWVQDKDVKMVIHPIKRRLNGKSLKASKDENGVPLFLEFEAKARGNADGGWVDYVWAKPGAEKATAKTSFVKVCGGGLGWIAGSGIWK
jgi:methyl-accepting chemotaxis protein